MTKCVLCKAKTPALTKLLCRQCHKIKSQIREHGRDPYLEIVEQALRDHARAKTQPATQQAQQRQQQQQQTPAARPFVAENTMEPHVLESKAVPPAHSDASAGAPHRSASPDGGPTQAKSGNKSTSTRLPVEPGERVVAKHAYTGTQARQLSFEKDAVIALKTKLSNGWWQGTLEGTSQSGWFPASFVRPHLTPKPLDEELRAAGGNTPALSSDAELQQTKGPDGALIDLSNIFVAKHEFRAEQPRQLSFPKKALIRVLTKKDNGWWNGELLTSLGGAVLATGWLPATYVRPYAAGATLVRLSRNGGALGFGIAGGKGSEQGDLDIFVSGIVPGSQAAVDDRLRRGDQIIEVNGKSLIGCTHTEAVQLLRAAGDTIDLKIIPARLPGRDDVKSPGYEPDTPATAAPASARGNGAPTQATTPGVPDHPTPMRKPSRTAPPPPPSGGGDSARRAPRPPSAADLSPITSESLSAALGTSRPPAIAEEQSGPSLSTSRGLAPHGQSASSVAAHPAGAPSQTASLGRQQAPTMPAGEAGKSTTAVSSPHTSNPQAPAPTPTRTTAQPQNTAATTTTATTSTAQGNLLSAPSPARAMATQASASAPSSPARAGARGSLTPEHASAREIEVVVRKAVGAPLGLGIAGGLPAPTLKGALLGIKIITMNPDGPAARTGQLQLRDTITRVGHVSFVGIDHQQAVRVLQEAQSKTVVILRVRRGRRGDSAAASVEDVRQSQTGSQDALTAAGGATNSPVMRRAKTEHDEEAFERAWSFHEEMQDFKAQAVAVERRLSQRRASASSTVSSSKDEPTQQPQSAVPPSPNSNATITTTTTTHSISNFNTDNPLSANDTAASVSSFVAAGGHTAKQETDVFAPVLRRDRGPSPADRRRALVFEAENAPSISAADVGVIDLGNHSDNDVFIAPPLSDNVVVDTGRIAQKQDVSIGNAQLHTQPRTLPQVMVTEVVQETQLDRAPLTSSVRPANSAQHHASDVTRPRPHVHKDSPSRSQSSSPALGRRAGAADGRTSPRLATSNKDELDGPSPPFLPPAAPTATPTPVPALAPAPAPAIVSLAFDQVAPSNEQNAHKHHEHTDTLRVLAAKAPAGTLVLSAGDLAVTEESTSDNHGPVLVLDTSMRGRIAAFGESGTDADLEEGEVPTHGDGASISSSHARSVALATSREALAEEPRSSPTVVTEIAGSQAGFPHRDFEDSHMEHTFAPTGRSSSLLQASSSPTSLISPPAQFSAYAPPSSFASASQQDDDTASSQDGEEQQQQQQQQHEGLSFHELVQATALGTTVESFVDEAPQSALVVAQAYSGSMDSLADATVAAPAALSEGTALSAGSACGSLGDLSAVGLDNALQTVSASSGEQGELDASEDETEIGRENSGRMSERRKEQVTTASTVSPTVTEGYTPQVAELQAEAAVVSAPGPRPRPVPRPRSTLFLNAPGEPGPSLAADDTKHTLTSSAVEHARTETVSPLLTIAMHDAEARAPAGPMPVPRPRVPSSPMSFADDHQHADRASAHEIPIVTATRDTVAEGAAASTAAAVADPPSLARQQQRVEEEEAAQPAGSAPALDERSRASSSNSSARSSPALHEAGEATRDCSALVPSSELQPPPSSSPRSTSPLAALMAADGHAAATITPETTTAQGASSSSESSSPSPTTAPLAAPQPQVTVASPAMAAGDRATDAVEEVLTAKEPPSRTDAVLLESGRVALPAGLATHDESAAHMSRSVAPEQPMTALTPSSVPDEVVSLSRSTTAHFPAAHVSPTVSAVVTAAPAVGPALNGPDSGVESTPVHSPPAEPVAPVSALQPESALGMQVHGEPTKQHAETLSTAVSAETLPAVTSLASGQMHKQEDVPASASTVGPAPASGAELSAATSSSATAGTSSSATAAAAQTKQLTREELLEKVRAEARARTEALRQRIRAESDARFKGPPSSQPTV